MLKAHKILARQLLITSLRGHYRNDKVSVFGPAGLVYLAVEVELVAATMQELFAEIKTLLAAPLTLEEVFYLASLLHLRFAHIHPFRDGNGRAARLLEKWFLAQKLGGDYWQLPSERQYKENQAAYYRNISLGVDFYELDYKKCLPFLAMLSQALLKTT